MAGVSSGSGGGRATRRSPGASRRTFLKGAGVGAFALGSAAVLPLFGSASAVQDPETCRAEDISAQSKRLVISNWPAYIDVAEAGDTDYVTTMQEFERRTGIDVDYTDDVNDNAEFFARVRNQLGACQPIDRDMMMLTDWMAARMIGLGWVQPISADAVPNLHANLIEPLRGRQWDPDRGFSAPWQSGLTGIAYNARLTGEVGSFKELMERDDLRGRITLLSEMRDTMAFMIKVTGGDPDDFTDDEWYDAIDYLRSRVRAGQVRAFTGNEYIQDLTAGNIMACEAWSGDVIQAQFDNPTSSSWCRRRASTSGATTCWCPTRPSTSPTPRSGSTTTTSRRSPPSSRPGSTTSVPSRGRARRWRRSTRRWSTTS